jgi:hypothetical protein
VSCKRPPASSSQSYTDATEEADMTPMISAELTRSRIREFHRNAQRDQLVRDTKRARREQRHSGAQARSGHPAGVLTRLAAALSGSSSPGE